MRLQVDSFVFIHVIVSKIVTPSMTLKKFYFQKQSKLN